LYKNLNNKFFLCKITFSSLIIYIIKNLQIKLNRFGSIHINFGIRIRIIREIIQFHDLFIEIIGSKIEKIFIIGY